MSASTSHPTDVSKKMARSQSGRLSKNSSGALSLRKIPSAVASGDDSNHSTPNVERRTARKIISPDQEPMMDVFSKKRKAGHKTVESNENEENLEQIDKAPKRSKRSKEAIVPMEVLLILHSILILILIF